MRTALARQLANFMLCGCCTITFAAVPVGFDMDCMGSMSMSMSMSMRKW